jgi:hypothetical protein
MSKNYRLKVGKVGQKVVDVYKGVEEKFCDTFLDKDENSEQGYTLKTGATAKKVVGAYKKIEGKFIESFLEEVDSEEK